MEAGCISDQLSVEAGVEVVEGQGGGQGLLDGVEGVVMIRSAEGDAFLEEIIEDTGKGREVGNEVTELVAKAKEAPDGSEVGGDGKVCNGFEVLWTRFNARQQHDIASEFHRSTNLEFLVRQDKPVCGTPEDLV